jgi:hypothetical protein
MEPRFTIRTLNTGDIGGCLSLSSSVSWNQTENDWKLLVEDPLNICLGAVSQQRVIGTATAIIYENKVAWIGMVLVDKSFRGRGISKILLSDLLDQLGSIPAVKLDATPEGQPVYGKFGFMDEYAIYRMISPGIHDFSGEKQGSLPVSIPSRALHDIIEMDCRVFGAKRDRLIDSLVNINPGKSWMLEENGKISGFALARQGRNYHQIGPVFASRFEDARALISRALASLNGQPVVVDIPAGKVELIKWLKATGFDIQRSFVRMYLETNPIPGKPENQFLICGPEFG